MSVQTTYDQTPAVAYPGMLAQEFSNRQIDSYLVEGTTIVGGQAVELGTDKEKQVIQLATAANFYGVALSVYENKEKTNSTIEFADKEMAAIMSEGRVWVQASAAVAVGVEVIPGTGANSGKWAAGTGTGLRRAFARSVAAADGDLLLIELSGPQGG